MAGFKEQIKAKFKEKFPKVNLSNKRLDAIVDKLDARTEAEDTIEAALESINDITPFEEMAREEDRIRQLEAKAKPKPENPSEQPANPPEEPDKDVPVWAKGLIESNKALEQQLAAINQEKTSTSRKTMLTEKLKDAPESYRNSVLKSFNRMQFATDEDFETYLEEAETDAKAFIQDFANQGLGKDKPSNSWGKTDAEKEVSADMKQYLAAQKETAA